MFIPHFVKFVAGIILSLLISTAAMADEKLPDLGTAPEIVGISTWLNTPSGLSLAELKGKVVLVDFWTYSCINCVRTLPHVTAWYEKYKEEGFVVIGVHAPEFDFEKETTNVAKAIKRFKISYPVAQDNDMLTWRNYDNKYWPAKYLIDANGHIRYTYFGEGNYEETENTIRQLLVEAGKSIKEALSSTANQTPKHTRTPETYLGAARMARFASPEGKRLGINIFSKPTNLELDHFAYEGTWNITNQSGRSVENSALELFFEAGKVFLVIGPKAEGDQIKVFIDGKPVSADQSGRDVKDSTVILDSERLYEMIDLKGNVGNHRLRLEFQNVGIAVYAFTFG